mgnify:CR=1 FL=1
MRGVAWAALLADDRDAAREHLALSDPTELHEDDVEAHRVVSSALAIEGEEGSNPELYWRMHAAYERVWQDGVLR